MNQTHSRREFLSTAWRVGIAGTILSHGDWCARWGDLSPRVLGAEPVNPGVDWLTQAQSIPATLPDNAPQLSPLLRNAAGEPITTIEHWEQHRIDLRDWWLKFLGPLATQQRPKPRLRVLETETLEVEQGATITRQRVEYEAEEGWMTEGYLLTPANKSGEEVRARLPGIVVFHSTVDHSIRQPAGIEGPPEKWFGLRFAQQGIVTFCPRNFLWPTNDKIEAKQETERFQQRHADSVGMAKMLYDAQLAVDILTAQPQVDPCRIGAIGHSLGAKEVLYLAAFDDRVKVTISSEGGVGVRFSNWDAPWYLGTKVNDPSFERDHHEILSMIAPRPFLLLGGDSADGERGWPFIREALPVYRLYANGEQGDRPAAKAHREESVPLAFVNHRQGHAVPPIAEQRIAEWVRGYL